MRVQLKRKLLSLGLAITIMFSVLVPVNAQSVETPEQLDSSINQQENQPRGFTKDYEVYAEKNTFEIFMEDDNWWGESSVTISMKKTSGPSSVDVTVYDGDFNYVGSRIITTSTAASFSIPKGSFKCMVTKNGGNDGWCTLSVTLSS